MGDLKKILERAKQSQDELRKKGLEKKRDILRKKKIKEIIEKAIKTREQYPKDKKKKKKFDFGWTKDMDPGMDPNYRFNLLPEEEKKKRRRFKIPVSKGNLLNKGGSVKLAKKYFKGGMV